MKLLLDTHTLLWYTHDDPQLSGTAEALILDGGNEVFVSPASYWEIAIKVSIGKMTLSQPLEHFIEACEQQYAFKWLPIMPAHAVEVSKLAFPKDHRDPFDRLLVAQATHEAIAIVSADKKLDAYDVNRLW